VIFTPRGLKVRFDIAYGFGLLARLYPTTKPRSVLSATEGIDLWDSMLALVGGLAGLYLGLTTIQIGLVAFGAKILARMLKPFIFQSVPGLVEIAKLYAALYGFGIPLLALLVTAYLTNTWLSILVYYAALLVWWTVETQYRMLRRGIDPPFTSSEWSFVYAYRYYATKSGASPDMEITDTEKAQSSWLPTFEDYSTSCPGAASRSVSAS